MLSNLLGKAEFSGGVVSKLSQCAQWSVEAKSVNYLYCVYTGWQKTAPLATVSQKAPDISQGRVATHLAICGIFTTAICGIFTTLSQFKNVMTNLCTLFAVSQDVFC